MANKLIEVIKSNQQQVMVSFKKVDRKKLREIPCKINRIISEIITNTITETNILRAASVLAAERLGIKESEKNNKNVEPSYKRRINRDIERLRKEINVLKRKNRGELRKENKYRNLEEKYRIKAKGLTTLIEELKQRTLAKIAKVKRYDGRVKQCQQKRLFQSGQKRFYRELNGDVKGEKIVPDTEESNIFWSSIWDNEAEHNRQAEWLSKVKEKVNHEKQQNLRI